MPLEVIPRKYSIDLDLSPNRETFSGSVDIEATSHKPLSSFELNARDLELGKKARVESGGKIYEAEIIPHPEEERAELKFQQTLPAGPMRIEMDFDGHLSQDMHGLYLGQDGPEKAVVSQCEAADARAIFPCFDEPEFKASLQWRVTTEPGMTVVTNGELQGQTLSPDGKTMTCEFAPTPPVSTYLAAVTVGEFDATPAQEVCGVPSRVLVGKGRLAQAEFAQAVTRAVVPWYENYFGEKYPYAKLDQVGVPGFDAGAMENAGAIFYRRSDLQVDESSASRRTKQRASEVVAHEIAHQWFGNLVTMEWWDSLWLNEAFATWISNKAVDAAHPELRMWDAFLGGRSVAMRDDALATTHPIYTKVESPAQATENFDAITYQKGCSVIRMVERYLGEEPFKQGIQLYMDEHKGGNATSSDLWQSLEKASGQPAEDLIRSWIEQPGFPVVKLDGDKVSQQRFNDSASEQKWLVPMVIRYEDEQGVKEHRMLLGERDGALDLPHVGEVKWVYPNADAGGFYRVSMSDKQLDQLLDKGLNHLTAGEKVVLLEDQWELARTGQSDLGGCLKVLSALEGERDSVVVAKMAGQLSQLSGLVQEGDRSKFQAFAARLMGPQWQELGSQVRAGESEEDTERRAVVASTLAGVAGQSEVLGQLSRLDPSQLDSGMASVALNGAARNGDASTVDHYLDQFARLRTAGATPETQLRYLNALSSFSKPEAVARVLEKLPQIPQEQLGSTLGGLLANREAQAATWQHLRQNWSELSQQVGQMGVSRLVKSLGALPPEKAPELKQFFASNALENASRAVGQALEEMQNRKQLAGRCGPSLHQFLN